MHNKYLDFIFVVCIWEIYLLPGCWYKNKIVNIIYITRPG